MRGFTIVHGTLGQQIRAQEHACRALETRIAVLPERVIVKLAPEAKHLTDTIRMVAYRAETALVRCLAPHDAKTEGEGHGTPLIVDRACAGGADPPDRPARVPPPPPTPLPPRGALVALAIPSRSAPAIVSRATSRSSRTSG